MHEKLKLDYADRSCGAFVSRGGNPYSGLYGEAPGSDFGMRKGHKVSCKVEEMVTNAKYIKGCYILAEMTTQPNQNN